ncbi:MAG: hypothetical protein WCF16_07135 [Alphaproteobacteria bacterium]
MRQAIDWVSRVSVALAGITVVLVVVNGSLFLVNQSGQTEVNRRQLFINQSVQLGRVSEALVRALAQASVVKKDDKLRDLLAQHGITFTHTPSGAAAPESGPPQGASPVAPGEAAPSEAAPSEAAPSEAAPSETMPPSTPAPGSEQ